MALDYYKRFFGHRWGCTDVFSEVPDKIRHTMTTDTGLDPGEGVVLAAFNEGIGLKGKFYVLVTEDRVIMRNPSVVKQSLFKDVKNVEKTPDNVKVRTDHDGFLLFASLSVPKGELVERRFGAVNRQWLAVRRR